MFSPKKVFEQDFRFENMNRLKNIFFVLINLDFNNYEILIEQLLIRKRFVDICCIKIAP